MGKRLENVSFNTGNLRERSFFSFEPSASSGFNLFVCFDPCSDPKLVMDASEFHSGVEFFNGGGPWEMSITGLLRSRHKPSSSEETRLHRKFFAWGLPKNNKALLSMNALR